MKYKFTYNIHTSYTAKLPLETKTIFSVTAVNWNTKYVYRSLNPMNQIPTQTDKTYHFQSINYTTFIQYTHTY